MNPSPTRLTLRDLSLPTRLVLATFLASVGFGYISALVQLHFQHATSGELLPTGDVALEAYHGRPQMSQLERVLTADESKSFNGSGSMRSVFTSRSAGWRQEMKRIKNDKAKLQALRDERDGERLALIDWVQGGADKQAYEDDAYALPTKLQQHPITEEYLVKDAGKKAVQPRQVKIQSIINDRCVRCHSPGKSVVGQFPLDTYENVLIYAERDISSGMSLTKLAQTTHVHLLGFSMLFGMTGLIFSLTSYPGWVRCLLGPFTLLAQLVDISCWWLARWDPHFAQVMVITGGLVAVGLLIHIIGSLLNMFDKTGKLVLLLLVLAVFVGSMALKLRLVDPYLEREREFPEIRDINKMSLTPDSNSSRAPGTRVSTTRPLADGVQER
jgi:hypothetical protein